MSWVQVAVSRSSEDIFDEDADEMYLLQKEWNSTMKKRLKEGYRDGIEAGKELALQEGFNQGYRHGAELMVTCGQFRGTLNALLSWCHSNGRDSALSKINNLLDVVGKHEEDVLKYLNSTDQQPHLGYILDSVQDMDLNDTAPAGTVYSEVKAGKHEDVDSSGGNVCGNNDGLRCGSAERQINLPGLSHWGKCFPNRNLNESLGSSMTLSNWTSGEQGKRKEAGMQVQAQTQHQPMH
uniref:YAE1 maturation factor of ABCE1 n=1 Tax=Bubo bubo TaxID=30461 RepID=A0A8C0FU47_BUBBB